MECSLISALPGGLHGPAGPSWLQLSSLDQESGPLPQLMTMAQDGGQAMWPSTTITSRPLIPVAVPEAVAQAYNFQAGPGPRATPLLNQSLNQT